MLLYMKMLHLKKKYFCIINIKVLCKYYTKTAANNNLVYKICN